MLSEVFPSVPEGGRIELRSTVKCMWTRYWFQVFAASSAEALSEGDPSSNGDPGLGGRDRCRRTVRFLFHSIGIRLPLLSLSYSRTKALAVVTARRRAAMGIRSLIFK